LFVYDQTARVPLIVWAPGRIPAAKREFARLVDVTPTILAAAGIPHPADLDGRSLLDPPASQTAYVETLYPYLNFGAAPVRALTDGRYKVINVPQEEVYDLDQDPAEARNVAREAAAAARPLGAALASLPPAPGVPTQPASDDEARALRSLGYVGAGGEYPLGREGMDPKSFAPLYRKLDAVHALCVARRWAEAVPVYEQLLAAFPRSSVLASELGLIEMALGRTAEAGTHLHRALDLNPENSHALLGMANLAIGRKDFRSAEGRLLDVLKLDPDDVEANFDLGALYAQNLGQPGKAAPYWRRFLELQPGDSEAPRIRGLLAEAERGEARR
jgi:tetratricopeptide (TPR) repeat protein